MLSISNHTTIIKNTNLQYTVSSNLNVLQDFMSSQHYIASTMYHPKEIYTHKQYIQKYNIIHIANYIFYIFFIFCIVNNNNISRCRLSRQSPTLLWIASYHGQLASTKGALHTMHGRTIHFKSMRHLHYLTTWSMHFGGLYEEKKCQHF